jgi:2-amino-4-hydroxy-6-hydroxymethyldihydropteridine diphosphokinase
MSLILALGTNLENKRHNLIEAKELLSKHFVYVAESRIFHSAAVDYIDQPDFYNQVIEFRVPKLSPTEIMDKCLEIENIMGRKREIDKGPRIIDIDVLFVGTITLDDPKITLPHPRLFTRSFVVHPLQELPYFDTLKHKFHFPQTFSNFSAPLEMPASPSVSL